MTLLAEQNSWPKNMVIAFDTDGTLIDKNEKPRKEIVELLKALHSQHNLIVVWSASADYAALWVKRLKLEYYVWLVTSKLDQETKKMVGIAIDDHEVNLGKFNIKI